MENQFTEILESLKSIDRTLGQIKNNTEVRAAGVRSDTMSDDALDRALSKLRDVEFLREALLRLGNYTTLFKRVKKNKPQKEHLANFFWKHCFWGIFAANPRRHHIFFESGSTLAYIASTFLEHIQEQPAWQKHLLPNVHITTNNLLVFLQYLINKDLAPHLELRPKGRPDTRYGATYGKLNDLIPYPPPLEQSMSDEVQEYIDDIRGQILSPALEDVKKDNPEINLLILASTSGMNSEYPVGPHAASYPNVLFKRALLLTRQPIVFFVDDSKFDQKTNYNKNRCFMVCDDNFKWDDRVKDQPIAVCVGARSAEARSIAMNMIEMKLTLSLKPQDIDEYNGFLPFIAANEKFNELFPGIGLSSTASLWTDTQPKQSDY